MNKQIIIKTDLQKENAIALISDLPYDTVHVVEIKEHKEALSSRQRRLYFKWLGEIAVELGEDKDDLHLRYKEKYLCQIYCRDDAGYSQMWESLRDVYRKGMKTDAVLLQKEIVKRTSIMDASTKQMAEYMKSIDVDSTMKGVVLTRPEEYDVKL